LSYKDLDGEFNEITDTDDLKFAFRYAEKELQNKVLKFLIETYLREGDNNKPHNND
jgi:hypothetical protein